nr:hypothetical protein [Tanacetum cinerariifolium]
MSQAKEQQQPGADPDANVVT